MRQLKTYLVLLSISMFLFSCNEKDKVEILFQENGSDWFSEGDADWKFINNELVGSLEEGAGFVMTKNTYRDFVLELEFKPDSAINSGVFVRCKNKELSNIDCYEINIWDLHPDQTNRTGAVVTRAKPLEIVETLDKWNNYKIKNQSNHLEVWINGVKTADITDNDLVEGPIALQAAESGSISFRNIKIQNLNAGH